VGADFNVPFTSALFYSGPKLAYDVTPYTGITFWAMATPGTSNRLRVKFPMRATTPVGGGGLCDEAMVGQFQCGDDWGADFDLPINGAWRQITVRFGQASFAQEGWGLLVPWNPREVTGVQIQASDANVAYDFWIDDVHLTH
jgi:hypothetical protein